MIPEHQIPNLTGLAPILLGLLWDANMQQMILDSLEDELNYWSPLMEIKTLNDTARDIFINEIFPYEKSAKNLSEDNYIREMHALFIRTFTGKHNDSDRQTGIEAEELFFNSILKDDGDETIKTEMLNSALMQLMNVACMYICDAADVMKQLKVEFQEGEAMILENSIFSDNKVFYYLCKSNYFIGLLRATHASNVGSKEQMKAKMIKLAEMRNAPLKKQLNEDLITIRKIWLENNWATYTECADHIFEKKIINRPYRKIYELVSSVAKRK